MARTTVGAVEGILLRDYDRKRRPNLMPFITTANVLVSKISSLAITNEITLSDEQLELIERWLSAHFYVVSDRTYAEARTEGAYAVYHGKTGLSLDFTPYGQMAKVLDTSGILAGLDKRQSATMFWLGTVRGEDLDTDD